MKCANEHNLLKKMGEGDEEAFASLYISYFPKVKRFIEGLLQDADDAMDLSQDIFIKIWRNKEEMQQVENLNAYLYTAARHAVYAHIRHLLVIKEYDTKTQQLSHSSTLPNTTNIEEELYSRELEIVVKNAVGKMPAQRKKVYEMSREEGKSNDEIAIKLSISKRTVENHLNQALTYLRKTLQSIKLFFI